MNLNLKSKRFLAICVIGIIGISMIYPLFSSSTFFKRDTASKTSTSDVSNTKISGYKPPADVYGGYRHPESAGYISYPSGWDDLYITRTRNDDAYLRNRSEEPSDGNWDWIWMWYERAFIVPIPIYEKGGGYIELDLDYRFDVYRQLGRNFGFNYANCYSGYVEVSIWNYDTQTYDSFRLYEHEYNEVSGQGSPKTAEWNGYTYAMIYFDQQYHRNADKITILIKIGLNNAYPRCQWNNPLGNDFRIDYAHVHLNGYGTSPPQTTVIKNLRMEGIESTDAAFAYKNPKNRMGNIVTIKIDIYNPHSTKQEYDIALACNNDIENWLRIPTPNQKVTVKAQETKTVSWKIEVIDPKVIRDEDYEMIISKDVINALTEILTVATNGVDVYIDDAMTIFEVLEHISNNYNVFDFAREFLFSFTVITQGNYVFDFNHPFRIRFQASASQISFAKMGMELHDLGDIATLIAGFLVTVKPDYALALYIAEAELIFCAYVLFHLANTYDPFDPLYNIIYIPNYNITFPDLPSSEMLNIVQKLHYYTNHLYGDKNAMEITTNRKNTAFSLGYMEATLSQSNALTDYTSRFIEDLQGVKECLTEYSYKLKEIDEELDILSPNNLAIGKDYISENGLPDIEVNYLKEYGFSAHQINSIITNVLESDIYQRENPTECIPHLSDNIDKTIYFLMDYRNELLKEITQLDAEIHGKPILEATQQDEDQIAFYTSLINEAEANQDYQTVLEVSEALIQLIYHVLDYTNNIEYIDELNFAVQKRFLAQRHGGFDVIVKKPTIIIEQGHEGKVEFLIANKLSVDKLFEIEIMNPLEDFDFAYPQSLTLISYDTFLLSIIIKPSILCKEGNYRFNISITSCIQKILEFNVFIIDDDNEPPLISFECSGDGTDGNSGYYKINVTDIKGISSLKIYIDGNIVVEADYITEFSEDIMIPNSLNEHFLNIEAWDNDDTSLFSNYTSLNYIIDDDTIPPEIIINYYGDNTDNYSGYFEWKILDSDNKIGGDSDIGLSEINITIKYESTEGLSSYIETIPGTMEGTWSLPPRLGIYTLQISARDNDEDRTLIIDSLVTELESQQKIIDDDISPPQLSNLMITHDIHNVNISFEAIDESGIKDIIILINGAITEPIIRSQHENSYFFTLVNQWILKNGVYNVEIQIIDDDNDRPDDASTSSNMGTFSITLEAMYDYVDWQLEQLMIYNDENLCWILSRILNWKLSQAQAYLQEAYYLVENGKTTCGLFHDTIAKVYLGITEFMTEIFDRISFISDENAEYIINSSHTIRNNIVILMGASIGIEQGYNLALIEIDLLNLNDLIEINVNWWNCWNYWCLINQIRNSISMLELTFYRLSMNLDIKFILAIVSYNLEIAKYEIIRLIEKGVITQELGDTLINEIESSLTDLNTILLSL